MLRCFHRQSISLASLLRTPNKLHRLNAKHSSVPRQIFPDALSSTGIVIPAIFTLGHSRHQQTSCCSLLDSSNPPTALTSHCQEKRANTPSTLPYISKSSAPDCPVPAPSPSVSPSSAYSTAPSTMAAKRSLYARKAM